jgi:hypothetical protein
LPALWFGPQQSAEHLAGFQRSSLRLAEKAAGGARQRSLSALILFVMTQRAADPELYYDDEERSLYRRHGDELRLAAVSVPGGAPTIRGVWAAGVVALALLFLGWRFLLSRHASVPWTLDLAVLCVLLLLISPLSRRAHLVFLCYPLAWIGCRLLYQVSGEGWRVALRQRPVQWAVVLLTVVFCMDPSALTVPIPGAQMPARPSMFLGMVCILVLLVRLGPHRWPGGLEPASNGDPHPTPAGNP